MAIFDIDPVTQRRDRTSMKWQQWPDVLPLWVAEMDAVPCQPVVDAVTAAISRGDTGYMVAAPFAEAVRDFAADRWNWQLDTSRVQVVSDVLTGVAECLRAVTREGGPVVITPPVYNCFYNDVAGIGRRAVFARLSPEGRLDLDTLEAAFVEATRDGEPAAFLLSNPHNPTGVVHTRAELQAVADLAARYGVRVVSDEIHAPLVFAPGTFTSYLTVDPTGVVVFSPSKAWNLAGLRAAVCVTGESDNPFPRLHGFYENEAPHMCVIAMTAALNEGRDWLDSCVRELDANNQLLSRLLAEQLPQVKYRANEATYLAWLDMRELDLGDDPATVLRERAGVALSNGINYDPEQGQGWARLNFATSPAVLTEAIERIATAV